MPDTRTPHDHAHHHPGAEGRHAMPDGTVTTGPAHDHAAHAQHAHQAHGPAAAGPAARGDRSQVEHTCPMHP